MTEYKSKAEILDLMHTTYAHFDALIAGLSEEQMQQSGVAGNWSIKDNIAHLSSWERQKVEILQAIEQGTIWNDPYHDETDELTNAINEQFYQQQKDRSLADVMTDFRVIHEKIISYTERLSAEALNEPREWLDGLPMTEYYSGTVEHYQEHEQIIRDWLANR